MKTIGRFIAAAILSLPAAFLLSSIVNFYVDERSRTTPYDASNTGFVIEAFFAGWIVSGLCVSLVTAGQHIRRNIAAVLLALPTSILLHVTINYFIEQMFTEDFTNGGIIFGGCWATASLWISRASTGRLVMSRGCGIFSMAAFALPIGIAVTVMVAPPIRMEYLTPLTLTLLSALVGVPLGLFSAGLAHVLRRQDAQMANGNELRNWMG